MRSGGGTGGLVGPFLIDSLKKSSAKREFADRLVKGDAMTKTGAPAVKGDQAMVKIHAPLPGERTIAFPDVCKTHFADGTFNPDSRHGRELLTHELTHVRQHGRRTD
jgi:hypothetical protein